MRYYSHAADDPTAGTHCLSDYMYMYTSTHVQEMQARPGIII